MDGQRDGREGRQEGGRVGQEFLDGRMMAFASTFEWEGAADRHGTRWLNGHHAPARPTDSGVRTHKAHEYPSVRAAAATSVLSSFDVRSYVVNSWECDRGKASCLRQNIQAVGTEAA